MYLYFHIDHNAPCLPLRILHAIVSNSPGYYSRPRRNRKQWSDKVWFFCLFGFLGGGHKVHYGLCVNGNGEFHSFLVLNMGTLALVRFQAYYSFIGIKYKCLSQSCFSISLICWGLLSITVQLDGASNQSVAKPNEN